MSSEKIEQLLAAHGVTPTSQRIEVAQVMLDKPQHLSAEQIIDRLRGTGSAVSKATVYNTLNIFSKNGLIKEINVDATRKYYDSTTHPHHHFYHVETAQLVDIPAGSIHIQDLPPLPPGTEQESVEVLIRLRSKT
jgi:Fur family iron response transcriptional regulator